MADHIFGQSISRSFIPLVDGEYFNLVSQAPQIYLFSELPSLEDAISGTGKFDTVAYWNESSDSPYARTYSISPIDDPEPTSETSCHQYYEAIRYAISEGQTQTRLRSFTVERAQALTSVPGTTVQDLKDVYPAISSYANDSVLEGHIANGEAELKLELESKGLEWGRIFKLKKYKLALAYKAIQLLSESQIEIAGDKFDLRRALYEAKYDKYLTLIPLAYDIDGDGIPDIETKGAQTQIIVLR
jgi:hypothetical protein